MDDDTVPHVDEDNDQDRLAWGLTLSISLSQSSSPLCPQARLPSPPPMTTSSPLEFTALPLPVDPPRELLIFIPLYPHNPTMPLSVYETQQLEEEEAAAVVSASPSRPSRKRKREAIRAQPPPTKKPDIDPPPFPWATPKRATVYSIQQLISKGLTKITGKVECSQCSVKRDIEFDLMERFDEVASYIDDNLYSMHHRAPSRWTDSVLPNCESCGKENSMKPIIGEKKREVNWLFLFLGEMIGCVNLDHLKYFCKHSKIHRTAAKDRLLYLTYLGLCKQLNPADRNLSS